MDAVEQNGYELIPHPAYSPDLAPSDFFLFPNLKKDIPGLHFQSDEEVVTAVEEWVNGKDPDFFSSGLMALEYRWSKCITLEGNYIENIDFIIFQNLKKDIPGLHFQSDEEVVTAVEEWVSGKDPDFFSSGLMALEYRWSKCITLEGNYIEKEEVDLNRK